MLREQMTVQEVFDTFNKKQKKIVTELIASAFEKRMPRREIVRGSAYIRSILDSLDEYQLRTAYYLIGCATMKRLTLDDLQVLKGDTNE